MNFASYKYLQPKLKRQLYVIWLLWGRVEKIDYGQIVLIEYQTLSCLLHLKYLSYIKSMLHLDITWSLMTSWVAEVKKRQADMQPFVCCLKTVTSQALNTQQKRILDTIIPLLKIWGIGLRMGFLKKPNEKSDKNTETSVWY